MLNGARDDGIGNAGEGASGVVLAVAEVLGLLPPPLIGGLELALCEAEGTELDRDAGTNAEQRRQRALVKGERALLRVDGPRGVERRRVRRARLQAHLHYVERLTCG